MPKAKPPPDSVHAARPHVVCAGAIDLHKKAFEAEEFMRLPGPRGKPTHAAIRIRDSTVVLAKFCRR